MFGSKEEKVKEIIITVLENSSLLTDATIERGTNLRDDLGLDSIALAELAVRIEDEYDIDVFEDGLVHTVEEILDKL
jgi:acyl carrier protein